MAEPVSKDWEVDIDIQETADQTEALARLRIGDREYDGWGRARRNPSDPQVPRIGEELATARALSELAHHLIEDVAGRIEGFEGHSVRVDL